MAVTPIYNLPYQSSTDAPDGAGLGQAGFLAVEAQLARIDTAAAAAAAGYASGPHGIVGGVRYTGSGTLAGGIGNTEALANMYSGSIALKANRLHRIKIRFKVSYSGSVTFLVVRIRDGSLGGAVIAEWVYDCANGAVATHTFNGECDYETSAAVTKNFALTMISAGASSTVSVGGFGTGNPGYVEVEDVGPAGIVTVQATP